MARRPAWQRIIQRITDAIGRPLRPPREPGQWPVPPPPPGPPPEPPEEPIGGDGLINVTDDFGIDRGTQTWDDWYRDTTLNGESFKRKFGYDFDNITLIHLLEEILDIEWDWEKWRADYLARNSAA